MYCTIIDTIPPHLVKSTIMKIIHGLSIGCLRSFTNLENIFPSPNDFLTKQLPQWMIMYECYAGFFALYYSLSFSCYFAKIFSIATSFRMTSFASRESMTTAEQPITAFGGSSG